MPKRVGSRQLLRDLISSPGDPLRSDHFHVCGGRTTQGRASFARLATSRHVGGGRREFGGECEGEESAGDSSEPRRRQRVSWWVSTGAHPIRRGRRGEEWRVECIVHCVLRCHRPRSRVDQCRHRSRSRIAGPPVARHVISQHPLPTAAPQPHR